MPTLFIQRIIAICSKVDIKMNTSKKNSQQSSISKNTALQDSCKHRTLEKLGNNFNSDSKNVEMIKRNLRSKFKDGCDKDYQA